MLNTKPSELPEKVKSDMPDIDAGMYPARICKIIYLGVQEEEKFGAKKGDPLVKKSKLMVFFELPSETFDMKVEDSEETVETRRTLIKEFPIPDAYNEKSGLIILFEAVCDKEEGYEDMIARPLLIEVGHTSTGNPKVKSTQKIVKGMTVPELESEPLVCLDFDEDVVSSLPEFIGKKIADRVAD